MYCPQCGREVDLESSDVRFCRYCGFSLLDTKESVQGYSQQKRVGFSIVTWCYGLLLIVTLLLHGQYIPLDTGWGFWLSAILIVASVSLFVSAALSASMPEKFAKTARIGKAIDSKKTPAELGSAQWQDAAFTQLPGRSGAEVRAAETGEIKRPRSVAEETTRKLDR